jgi:hypothetical protein
MPHRARMREIAAECISKGDPLGWFEKVYQEAERGDGAIPWADLIPNPGLIDFWKAHPLETAGKRALVVGSGLGDDAEQIAARGFKTTGFDISKTAVEAARKRFSKSEVEYVAANLFDPPAAWLGSFDFVLEIYTVQSLPSELRSKAIAAISQFVALGGALLVIARERAEGEPESQGPPWPLTRAELGGFLRAGLEEQSFEEYAEPQSPSVRRFRALYRRGKMAP